MNWIQAILLELFAIPLIIFLQILGLIWKPSFKNTKTGTPILLIHGYINTDAIWIYIKWKLRKLGPIYTIHLKGPFNSIENYAKQVEKMGQLIEKETKNQHLILIGYSMGGLVASYYAAELAPKGKVKKIIAISSPFQGTSVARIALGKNGLEMRRGSHFLQNLTEEIDHLTIPLYTIASKTDEIIVPYTSALIGSKQIIFKNLGHGALVFSSRVASVLIHLIET